LSQVNQLPEKEFTMHMIRGPLWPRRIELLLMQLTNVIARCNGNKTVMSDFDLFNKQNETAADNAANDIAVIAGAGVRKLGQGRRE